MLPWPLIVRLDPPQQPVILFRIPRYTRPLFKLAADHHCLLVQAHDDVFLSRQKISHLFLLPILRQGVRGLDSKILLLLNVWLV